MTSGKSTVKPMLSGTYRLYFGADQSVHVEVHPTIGGPVTPLQSESDLDEAISTIDTLLGCGCELSSRERLYLEKLSDVVIEYEATNHAIPPVPPAAPGPGCRRQMPKPPRERRAG